jgi:hypothetical protein
LVEDFVWVELNNEIIIIRTVGKKGEEVMWDKMRMK